MSRPYTDYGKFSYFLTLGLSYPILMDAYLATASIHLAATDPEKTVSAVQLYNSAIHDLQRMLNAGELDGNEDWLLLVSICLCLFEVCSPEEF